MAINPNIDLIYDRNKVSYLRDKADTLAEKLLQCEGEYHPNFHDVSDQILLETGFLDGIRHAIYFLEKMDANDPMSNYYKVAAVRLKGEFDGKL